MTRRPVPTQRLARWSLLLAALLQFGGAAVGPYLHFSGLELLGAPIAALERGADEPSSPLRGHDEQTCIVCQTVASTGLIPEEAPLLIAFSGPDARIPEAPPSSSSSTRPGARARAPPSA